MHSFGRHAADVDGYTGPTLTVKGGGLAATSSADDAEAGRCVLCGKCLKWLCAHHVECLCCVSPAGIRQLDSFGWILIVSLLACHGTRSGKVRSLSARLKIPTGAAARIVEPGSVEWLELQRGAAYTPSSGSPAAGSDAATALAGIMTVRPVHRHEAHAPSRSIWLIVPQLWQRHKWPSGAGVKRKAARFRTYPKPPGSRSR